MDQLSTYFHLVSDRRGSSGPASTRDLLIVSVTHL